MLNYDNTLQDLQRRFPKMELVSLEAETIQKYQKRYWAATWFWSGLVYIFLAAPVITAFVLMKYFSIKVVLDRSQAIAKDYGWVGEESFLVDSTVQEVSAWFFAFFGLLMNLPVFKTLIQWNFVDPVDAWLMGKYENDLYRGISEQKVITTKKRPSIDKLGLYISRLGLISDLLLGTFAIHEWYSNRVIGFTFSEGPKQPIGSLIGTYALTAVILAWITVRNTKSTELILERGQEKKCPLTRWQKYAIFMVLLFGAGTACYFTNTSHYWLEATTWIVAGVFGWRGFSALADLLSPLVKLTYQNFNLWSKSICKKEITFKLLSEDSTEVVEPSVRQRLLKIFRIILMAHGAYGVAKNINYSNQIGDHLNSALQVSAMSVISMLWHFSIFEKGLLRHRLGDNAGRIWKDRAIESSFDGFAAATILVEFTISTLANEHGGAKSVFGEPHIDLFGEGNSWEWILYASYILLMATCGAGFSEGFAAHRNKHEALESTEFSQHSLN